MSNILPLEFINWAMRLMLAQGVIFLFLLLNVVSFSMPHAGDFKPFFLLMVVYYWAIYRPSVMPVAYTFVLGLVFDLLAHVPLGLNALLLVGLRTIVQHSRLFLMAQPYMVVWLGFALMALANALCLYLIIALSTFDVPSLMAFTQTMVAAALSILLFPLATFILQAIHRALPAVSNAQWVGR